MKHMVRFEPSRGILLLSKQKSKAFNLQSTQDLNNCDLNNRRRLATTLTSLNIKNEKQDTGMKGMSEEENERNSLHTDDSLS
mmetsp:Transcript_3648/g.4878  ORF Transcript_3648/g.4878 Transcript_3648/m.4878 type:complete len:82 (+) Transcript_3648:318-563(+)